MGDGDREWIENKNVLANRKHDSHDNQKHQFTRSPMTRISHDRRKPITRKNARDRQKHKFVKRQVSV